jgi:hypothetical protein
VPGIPDGALHVTNGDAVVPELAEAAGIDPGEVLVWREVLHDGPVPAGLDPDELARVRARHLSARDWFPPAARDSSPPGGRDSSAPAAGDSSPPAAGPSRESSSRDGDD